MRMRLLVLRVARLRECRIGMQDSLYFVVSYRPLSYSYVLQQAHSPRRVALTMSACDFSAPCPEAAVAQSTRPEIGAVKILAANQGVKIEVNLSQLPPGIHGIHIHDVGKCEGPDFTSVGGIMNWSDLANKHTGFRLHRQPCLHCSRRRRIVLCDTRITNWKSCGGTGNSCSGECCPDGFP
jgi:Copper/zinc superoxide dismutase (SODC)